MKSVIDSLRSKLDDNESARKNAHAIIDTVHDEIQISLSGGIQKLQSMFLETPVEPTIPK